MHNKSSINVDALLFSVIAGFYLVLYYLRARAAPRQNTAREPSRRLTLAEGRRYPRDQFVLLECGAESLKCPVLQTVFANIVWNR
jgi:hypothetical protein